jgi:hypothetical protein
MDTEGLRQEEPTLGSVAGSKARGSFGLIGISGSALWKLPVQAFRCLGCSQWLSQTSSGTWRMLLGRGLRF